jgi:hypothetical protein
MATLKRSTVVGVFPNAAEARDALDELRRLGFPDNQLGMLTREQGSHWAEGAAIGAVAGGAVGAAGLAGAAAAGLMIPGLGPVFGAGLLLAALTGGGAGVVAGGIVGALVGLEIPEEHARFYESEVEAGRTLVTVEAGDRHDEAWTILKRFGAYNVHDRGPVTPVSDQVIPEVLPVTEDDLRAGGLAPAHGEAVIEEEVIEVPVRLEDLAGQETTAASWPTGEGVRIPVRAEEVWPEDRRTAPDNVAPPSEREKSERHRTSP